MNYLNKLICMAGAAALPCMAAAHDAQAATARVDVRHYLPLTSACPGVLAQLPEQLYPAWRALDSTADVVVDFKLEGGKISDVKMTGGHGDYKMPVRRAVKAMGCTGPGQGAYAVRFRIKFVYPEDQGLAQTVMQISDETPALAMVQ
ncbi:MAG: hypothetical protein V4484_15285 [Pseudomonadota bacterium]